MFRACLGEIFAKFGTKWSGIYQYREESRKLEHNKSTDRRTAPEPIQSRHAIVPRALEPAPLWKMRLNGEIGLWLPLLSAWELAVESLAPVGDWKQLIGFILPYHTDNWYLSDGFVGNLQMTASSHFEPKNYGHHSVWNLCRESG